MTYQTVTYQTEPWRRGPAQACDWNMPHCLHVGPWWRARGAGRGGHLANSASGVAEGNTQMRHRLPPSSTDRLSCLAVRPWLGLGFCVTWRLHQCQQPETKLSCGASTLSLSLPPTWRLYQCQQSEPRYVLRWEKHSNRRLWSDA